MLEADSGLTDSSTNNLNKKNNLSKLLINESPLQVLPSLAVLIGLNEAIVLQQIHYWISNELNNNLVNGRKWVYNTYAQWCVQFPFWSKNTIIRTIDSLEDIKLIISGSFNKLSKDRTKWYTINYEKLESLEVGTSTQNGYMTDIKTDVKNDRSIYPKWVVPFTQNEYMHLPNLGKCNTIDYIPEITHKNIKKNNKKKFEKEFEEFWEINPKAVDKAEAKQIFESLLAEDYDNFKKIMDGRRAQNIVIEFEGTEKKYIKSPAAWLRKKRFNDEVQTKEQLNAERQRAISKVSRKSMGKSTVDEYHNLNARVRENARQHLAASIKQSAKERGEDWEWDGSDNSLGITDF